MSSLDDVEIAENEELLKLARLSFGVPCWISGRDDCEKSAFRRRRMTPDGRRVEWATIRLEEAVNFLPQ